MPDQSQPAIRIRDLYKIFGPSPNDALAEVKAGLSKADLLARDGHVLALKDIDLDIGEGTITAIMGLSGSGKSTLLRHINFLIAPTGGTVEVLGHQLNELTPAEIQHLRRHTISMVFQSFALFPHKTVRANIAFGLSVQGRSQAEIITTTNHWIDRMGLVGFADHYPVTLSGGMQQRVGLARALATDAEVLLLDEPFSALDPLIRQDMQTLLLDLQNDLRKTIVVISHDLDEALKLGDRVLILAEGEVVQDAPPAALLLNPANAYVERFTARINSARVLTLGDIVSRNAAQSGDITLPASLTLEAALETMIGANAVATLVTDSANQPLGRADLHTIMAAIRGHQNLRANPDS